MPRDADRDPTAVAELAGARSAAATITGTACHCSEDIDLGDAGGRDPRRRPDLKLPSSDLVLGEGEAKDLAASGDPREAASLELCLERRLAPASCKACIGPAECPGDKPACNNGYCEAQ